MQGESNVLFRYLSAHLESQIRTGYSSLILGPRQVGKTTLVHTCLSKIKNVVEYPLQDPGLRITFETDPSRLIREIRAHKDKPIVFIDEAQKVPDIFDSVQVLIDEKKASFFLTGSSARKLRRSSINLLPGRIKRFHLDPLLWGELGLLEKCTIEEIAFKNINERVPYSFNEMLVYGSLPGIVNLPVNDRADFLTSYAQIYLEEEIRAEAISRKIGAFSRFLELAAIESGTNPNLTKISNESGVSQPAIKQFYTILEDTLVMHRIEPYMKNARKRILSSPRYYFFDIGVRNALARIPLHKESINAQKGTFFEHAVILEIIRRIHVLNKNYKVCFWRTSGGAEVDCVIDMGEKVIPIEIKASGTVSLKELKGLKVFLSDYHSIAKNGYVITMGERKEKIGDNIIAIPWFEM
ncbi:MAG: hypothetical protein COY53_01790 [Elusimicrobia bacterium CG_4_10_14_0_8_um_filter_37_32]|nr:MAG: hypothetical protein COS17_06590 [Elusimicrobia bacterium CG02_land_8_20_14_3_00_37_13]PIZ14012.1 MAG: hypothetical protein COY53_01790 [Elusimicrobia bacterium CG_4_10_14_0_8_um_filter_37_32]